MTHRILVFYGSYRSDRMGIRLAHFVVEGFRARGEDVELIDAKAVNLPMLDRMYKEHPKGEAPPDLATVIVAHVEQRLRRAFRPAAVHVMQELPKTRSLKIMRRVIRFAVQP